MKANIIFFSLINDIPDPSNIEVAQLELKTEKFQVHDLETDSLAFFFEESSKRGIKINTEIDNASDMMEV